MKRDPHLPHPEVCDWLLSQEWSKPSTVFYNSEQGKGYINDCCEASAAIGRDEIIDLLLPLLGLQILREDVVARQADAYEANGLTPEQRLMVDLSELLRLADVSATAAVGVLTMATLRLTSQVHDIGMEQDGEVEP